MSEKRRRNEIENLLQKFPGPRGCGHVVSWALPSSEDFHKWDSERVWLDLGFDVNILCFLFTQVSAI